jgi:hypothetical protein
MNHFNITVELVDADREARYVVTVVRGSNR